MASAYQRKWKLPRDPAQLAANHLDNAAHHLVKQSPSIISPSSLDSDRSAVIILESLRQLLLLTYNPKKTRAA